MGQYIQFLNSVDSRGDQVKRFQARQLSLEISNSRLCNIFYTRADLGLSYPSITDVQPIQVLVIQTLSYPPAVPLAMSSLLCAKQDSGHLCGLRRHSGSPWKQAEYWVSQYRL